VGWTIFMVLTLGVLPALLLGATTALASRRLAGGDVPGRRVLLRMAYGLVPLGFAMWIAHYGFHFLASGLTLVPVLHRRHGRRAGGRRAGLEPGSAGPRRTGSFPFELLSLEIGLLASLGSSTSSPGPRSPACGPPAAPSPPGPWRRLLLAAAGAWIMTQPMAMRGMMMDMPGHVMPGHDMNGHGMDGTVTLTTVVDDHTTPTNTSTEPDG
jgi:hypothetical protein